AAGHGRCRDTPTPQPKTGPALAPARVTLRATNTPTKEPLAEITRQPGYKLALTQDNTDREKLVHSFRFDNLPFWEALQRVCEAGGLLLQQNYYGDDILRLQPTDQEQFNPYVHLNGAFRLVAQGF